MTKENDVSRRDAIKMVGATVGSALMSPILSVASESAFASSLSSSSSKIIMAQRGHKGSMTIVEPMEINDSLANPGRGFATTGNTYNEDIQNQRYPTSGVIQQRWYWDDLEPEEGHIKFSMIDRVLEKAAKNRQQLNFRVMCQNHDMRLPRWAKEQGIKPPYYDNPVFLDKQAKLIKALAERYDGNANLAYVDIGTIGQWGEWHTSSQFQKPTGIKMPSRENCLKVIDVYLKNFKKTPLLMQIGAEREKVLYYALEHGTGWRADCWGDMSPLQWHEMKGFYPKALSASHAYDAWKQGPVALETCWTMSKWHKENWDIHYILSWALQQHVSEVNNKDRSIPEEWWPNVRDFEKIIGCRFALKRLSYSSEVAAGGDMNYTMKWANKGVAPIYQPGLPNINHAPWKTTRSRNVSSIAA